MKDTIKELSTEVKGAVMKIERHEAHLNNGILSTINKIENRMWAFLAMSFFTVASSVAALVALLLR